VTSAEPREVSIRTARRRLADLVNRATYRGERTVLARDGRRVAAVVPMSDLRTLPDLEISEATVGEAPEVPIGKRIARRLAAELGIPLDAGQT
jgi:prevent-host-death family protein